MIKTHDAIRTARILLGTPYKEMDCIALIRAVIKRTAGGVSDYRCEGTNWLWRSIDNASKYRHLIWRQESIKDARAGMLAFKREGDNIHHVGLVTDVSTVIHSSSVTGCVVETELDNSWDLLGQHKYIAVLEDTVRNNAAAIVPNDTVDSNNVSSHPNNMEGYSNNMKITIVDSAGNHFEPIGDWRVLVGSVD